MVSPSRQLQRGRRSLRLAVDQAWRRRHDSLAVRHGPSIRLATWSARTGLPPMRSSPPPPARDERSDEERRDRGLSYWRRGKPIRGTLVEKYLTARLCPLPPIDGHLRFIEHISEFGFSGPAMLALVTSALDDRQELAVHITWLLSDGSGRAKDGRRPLGRTGGGCIRLWPDESVELASRSPRASRPRWPRRSCSRRSGP